MLRRGDSARSLRSRRNGAHGRVRPRGEKMGTGGISFVQRQISTKQSESSLRSLSDYPRLVHHQTAVERDVFSLTGISRDVVVLGQIIAEPAYKGGADAAAFFIDGIAGGINQIVDALLHLSRVIKVRYTVVNLQQLLAIVDQLFEPQSFGMAQEEEIDHLGECWQGDLHIVVVGQEDAVILGDAKCA